MSNTEISAPLKTSDNDDKSVTKALKPTPKKNSKFGVIFLVITFLVGAAVGGYFLFNKINDRKSSASLESNELCILNIKDSHTPILEITLAASHSEAVVSETQAREVEKAIVEAYNDASGGCSDDFKRWMYGINVLDQTVLKHVVLEEEAESSISKTFDTEYNLVIRLETMISCDGCVDDEAFASVYPPSFGNRASTRHLILSSGYLSSDKIYEKIVKKVETTFGQKISKMNLITMNSQHASYYEEAASGTTASGSKGTKSYYVGDTKIAGAALGGAKGSKGSPLGGAIDGAMAAAAGIKGSKADGRSDCGRAASKDGSKSGAKGGDRANRADGASKDGSKSGAKGGERGDRADGSSKGGAKGGERGDRADGASKGGTKGGERGQRADGTSKGGAKGGIFKGTKADRTRSDCDPRPPPPTPVRVEIPTNPPTRFVYTPQPTDPPTSPPTPVPTPNPTPDPTPFPTRGFPEFAEVTPEPTPLPTPNPTPLPTPYPTRNPTAPPTVTPCDDDPCQLRFIDDTEASCDPKVQTIIEIDSWCGVQWDPWCAVAYSQCYGEVAGCNLASIEEMAGDQRVDISRIKCPPPEIISEAIAGAALEPRMEDPTCPNNFPGTGASCEATNLQCYYFYGDMEWVCNCGASPTEFYCKPKNE